MQLSAPLFALNVKYIFATIYIQYIQNTQLLAFVCGCTGQFVSDMVGNPVYRFSRDIHRIVTEACMTVHIMPESRH